MKISIKGKGKEIADFVLAVQSQQQPKMSIEEFQRYYEEFKTEKSNHGKL